jgi:serine O-acetyltransferase
MRIHSYLANAARAARALPWWFADVRAIYRNDPALSGGLRFLEIPLYASFWATLAYRIAHLLDALGLPFLPRLLSQLARLATGIEIHPAARIGRGFFVDHGMGVVIGGTAVVGRDVLLYHGVTLGAVRAIPGKRHPTLEDGVVVGAGAAILGPITVGRGARVGAGAVVLRPVPAGATVVGVPAGPAARPAAATGEPLRCCG